MEEFDVIVIGAGLAGLQVTRLLARHDLRVLLVDRKASLEQRIHTTGIFVRKTLEDFDIPEESLGPAIRHVNLYSPARRVLELVSDTDEFRIGRMGLLYQRFLQQCLHPGVRWQPATQYLTHQVTQDRLIVNLSTEGRISQVRTRYLIGSDGARSRVARDLGLEQNREWIVGVENIFTGTSLAGPPRLLCFLDPEIAPGYLAWVAHDGQETHIGVGGYPAKFEPLAALEKFQASLAPLLDLEGAKQGERRGGLIPVGGVLQNIANRHGLLIGDAAGAVSPLTAGGLDPCMRLSSMAAMVVVEYLGTGNSAALSSYSGELFRARFTSRLWARRLASSVRSRSLVELGCAALRLPLVSRFASHVFFGRGSFPDVTYERSQYHLAVADGLGPRAARPRNL
jgi:flavin-dependent dehydrogenase